MRKTHLLFSYLASAAIVSTSIISNGILNANADIINNTSATSNLLSDAVTTKENNENVFNYSKQFPVTQTGLFGVSWKDTSYNSSNTKIYVKYGNIDWTELELNKPNDTNTKISSKAVISPTNLTSVEVKLITSKDKAPDGLNINTTYSKYNKSDDIQTPLTNNLSLLSSSDKNNKICSPGTNKKTQYCTPIQAINKRSHWNAKKAKSGIKDKYLSTPPLAFAIMHTVNGGDNTSNTYALKDVPRIIREMQTYAMNNDYDDIGYNFIVDRFGNIWESRTNSYSASPTNKNKIQHVNAGELYGFNNTTVQIGVLGDYTKNDAVVSNKLIQGLGNLIGWKANQYNIPVGTDDNTKITSTDDGKYCKSIKYPAGTIVTTNTIVGAKDLQNCTESPGKIEDKLNDIRNKAHDVENALK